MSLYKNTKFKRIAAALFAAIMILTLTACDGKTFSLSSEMKPELPANVNTGYHKSGKMESSSKTGLYELLVDKKNCSFAIKDTAGTVWNALPASENREASLLKLVLTDGEKTYELNSQDNALAFGKVKTKSIKDGIRFSYVFSEKKDSPRFTIPLNLDITLIDGQLTASVDFSKISKNAELDGFKIASVELLPYFGADDNAAAGDFILIPDGSGGLIDLEKSGDSDYEVLTYGPDYAVQNSGKHSGIIAAFGLKKGNGAFAGIVTEGDAISKIESHTSKNGFDNVYASFDITPNAYNKGGKGEGCEYALANSCYGGKISVCYRFINGSAATYGGLAAMCREQFIREGYMSTRTVNEEKELPLNVTLIGGIKNNLTGTTAYTSFENAEDISAVLKAKGINALNIKYDGVFSGGLEQKALSSARLLSKLGGKSEFESLQNYLLTQGFDLYLNLDLITTASNGSKADGILNNSVKIKEINDVTDYLGPKSFMKKGLNAEKLTDNVVKFMNRMKDMNISGYCAADVGSVLYSDFSGGYTDRQSYADDIFGQIIALSTNKNLMVEHGNMYALKNALIVSEIPMTVSYKENSAYTAVPFVQMVLHGTVEYTGDYLNLADDYNKALLKAIEYGSMPSFKWTYNDYIPKGEEKSRLYFENWTQEALDVYNAYNSIVKNLRGAKMTNHTKVAEGVYCTEYNNETFIYVNYTDADVEYNNLTIKAGSYLRVN